MAKKKIQFGFMKVQTHTMPNVKSMHNHSTNSCFVIIYIIIWLYYHSSWSSTYL